MWYKIYCINDDDMKNSNMKDEDIKTENMINDNIKMTI